jgi:Putative metallopeptidase family (DUF6782)
MLRQSPLRVEVPASWIDGQTRHAIEKARHWLQADLKLVDLVVEYFTVRRGVFDQGNQRVAAQADLGEFLEDEEGRTCGYVSHDARVIANLRADRSLQEMLATLTHEARHIHQLTTSVGSVVSVDWREADAENYAEKALPRMFEELRWR